MKKNLIILFLVIPFVALAQVDIPKNAEYFSKGLECKYKEDVQGAIKNFEQALKFMPDDAASMFELSEQYVHEGQLDEGFIMIKKAAELDPENKWYQMRLALFCKNFGQYDEFIKIYEALTAKYPGDVNMLADLMETYIETKNYDKAVEKLDLLEKQVGTNTRFYHLLAKAYMQEGKEKKALKLYEKIKEKDPNDQYVNISLLECYEKKGDYDKAFEELLEVINNENLDFNTKANIYEHWFTKFQDSKNIDQQALQAGNAFIKAHPDYAMGYLVLASYHINRNDYQTCKSMALKALDCDKTNYAAWQYLVLCEAPLMETDSLMKHSVEALNFYPTQPIFYWYAGVSHALAKQDDEAVNYFEKGRRFVTDKRLLADFDSYLGDLYHSIGEVEKSFQAYDRVLNFDPDNALVLNNYAYYLSLRKERLDEAKEMALHAVELEPNNAIYLDTYAWVLYQKGEYEAAETQMSKAIKLLKQPDMTYYQHYADILEKVNKPEKAKEYLDKINAAKDEK